MAAGIPLIINRKARLRLAVSVLLIIPIIIPLLAAALIWLNEAGTAERASERVMTATRLAGSNIRTLVTATLDRLHRFDDALGPDPAAFKLGAAPVTTRAGFVGLYDADGLTVTRDGSRGASVANNDDFRALADGKAWTMTPLISQGGIRLVGIARRIERDGKFAGVATVYLQADLLSETWASLELGSDSTLGLIRADGQLITQYPVPESGSDLSQSPLFKEQLGRAPRGIYQPGASPSDGSGRIAAYERLDDLDLIVTASMSRKDATGAFWSRVGATALVSAPAFIMLLVACGGLALVLVRQERSRVILEAALSQNKLLLQEIHHRVKNNLQAVAAMVNLQATPQEAKDELIGRIAAVTSVHQLMYETDRFGDVDVGKYLEKLLAGLKAAAPRGVMLKWNVVSIILSPDQAMPLGLILNELVLNAFKHGFPAGREGEVVVTFFGGEGQARLNVKDTGIGKMENEAAGMGSRLITGFVRQLKGAMTSGGDGGHSVEVRFPISLE